MNGPTSCRDDVRLAFREWLTAGGSRVGEVVIRAAGSGYILTHWRDADADPATLERFTRPEDARELARFGGDGAYRPLKTAPNLRRGWRLELSGFDALCLAVGFFYPAALGVAAARREGRLRVVPLRETLERQSGMYAVTRKISDAGAEAAIARCCRSPGGGCLKTILWEIGAVGGRSGPENANASGENPSFFPLLCNEACNLLVAAIRKSLKSPPESPPGPLPDR